MVRATIRRAGVLAATTALAGTAFAGTALAGLGSEENVTGVGGAGGAGGDNAVQCVISLPIATNDAVSVLGLDNVLGNSNDIVTANSCSSPTYGGGGGSSSAAD